VAGTIGAVKPGAARLGAARRLAAQHSFGGQPAARHEPASATIRIVTIAFVRPLSARRESSQAGSVWLSYRDGQKSRSC